jgi:hypothetical protein
LTFVNEPWNDTSNEQQWRSLGYTQTKFTGDMYDMRQPETPWLAKFREHFQLNELSWSVYKMIPGCVLPEHSDSYPRFRRIHNLTSDHSVVRVVLFLEDWASGHYLEMNKTPVVKWRAGDWVAWRDDFLHLSANVGKTDRYTIQLTGYL